MILVDSSVWIDFFNARQTPHTLFLKSSIGNAQLLIGDIILAEVLQGFDTDREFESALDRLRQFDPLAIASRDVAIEAARNHRRLRGLGITIRKAIDTLIATRCVMGGVALLYRDRDFDPFVRHLGLKSAMALH